MITTRKLAGKRNGRENSWISYILWMALLVLFCMALSSVALADSVSGALGAGNKYSFLGYVNQNDLSISVLSSVLGTVQNVPYLRTAPETVFGQIFKILSYGALFLETILLMYMTTKMVSEVTIEGGMADKNTMFWVPVRSSLSMSLLIPHAGTGYSIIHSIVLMIVVQGIGMANQLWKTAVHYMVVERKAVGGAVSELTKGTNDLAALDKGQPGFVRLLGQNMWRMHAQRL